MKIRSLNAERDLEGYLEILHQVDRFPRSAAEWRERQREAGPDEFRRHLVGEVDGRIVAIATLMDNYMASNAVVIRLVVDARLRGRGHGRAMAAAAGALLAERVPAPDAIDVRLRDDDPVSRAWVERRGFALHDHAIRSRLDLTTFDPVPHRQAVERAEAAGLRFETADDGDRLYALYARLLRTVPDRLEPPSRDWFERQRAEHPDAIHLVAADGAAWVALAIASTAMDPPHEIRTPSPRFRGDPGEGGAWNDFTGVSPDHRRRGIARALKVLVAERLIAGGRLWVEATNNARNGPMLALNRALGYRPVEGMLFLRRALR